MTGNRSSGRITAYSSPIRNFSPPQGSGSLQPGLGKVGRPTAWNGSLAAFRVHGLSIDVLLNRTTRDSDTPNDAIRLFDFG
jgi:hypothetical protein